MYKILPLLLSALFSIQAQAFPCYLTIAKDNCWTNYNVTVAVTDGTTGKNLTNIVIPQGTSWGRQQIDCQPAQIFSFLATFSPVIWESDAGKSYPAQHEKILPEKITAGDTAWSITLCYPTDFAEVPLPPEAGSNCKCDIDNIPPIKP